MIFLQSKKSNKKTSQLSLAILTHTPIVKSIRHSFQKNKEKKPSF